MSCFLLILVFHAETFLSAYSGIEIPPFADFKPVFYHSINIGKLQQNCRVFYGQNFYL